MHTGHDHNLVVLNSEEQSVRKSSKSSRAEVPLQHRERRRIFSNAVNCAVDLSKKVIRQRGANSTVPHISIEDITLSLGLKRNLLHLPAALDPGANLFPSRPGRSFLIQPVQASVQLGILFRSERHLVAQAFPQAVDQIEPFLFGKRLNV
jgi:hypothetical protein